MEYVTLWRVWESDREAGLERIAQVLDPLVRAAGGEPSKLGRGDAFEQSETLSGTYPAVSGLPRPGRVPLLGWRYVDDRHNYQGEIRLDLGLARELAAPPSCSLEERLSYWNYSRRLAGQLLALAVELESQGVDFGFVKSGHFFRLIDQPAFSEAHYLLDSGCWFAEKPPRALPAQQRYRRFAELLTRILWGTPGWNEMEWVKDRDVDLPREGENRAGLVVGRLAQGGYRCLQDAWQEWNQRQPAPESSLVTRWGEPLSAYRNGLNQGRFRRELPLGTNAEIGSHKSWLVRGWVSLHREKSLQLDWEMEGTATPLGVNSPEMAEKLVQRLIEWEEDGLELSRVRPWHLFVRQEQPCLCLPLLHLEGDQPWGQCLYAPSRYREVARLLNWAMTGQDFDWGAPARLLGEEHPVVVLFQGLASPDGRVRHESLRQASQSNWRSRPTLAPESDAAAIERSRPTCHPMLARWLRAIDKEQEWCRESRVVWREWIEPNGKYCEAKERGAAVPMRSLAGLKELMNDFEGAQELLTQAEALTDADQAISLLEQVAELACPQLPGLGIEVFDLRRQVVVGYDPQLAAGAFPSYYLSLRYGHHQSLSLCDWPDDSNPSNFQGPGFLIRSSKTYGLLLSAASGLRDWELAWSMRVHSGDPLPRWDGTQPLLLLLPASGKPLDHDATVLALRTANHLLAYESDCWNGDNHCQKPECIRCLGLKGQPWGFHLSWGETRYHGEPPAGFWDLLEREQALQNWQARDWGGEGQEWTLRVSYQGQRLHCWGRGPAPSPLAGFGDLFPPAPEPKAVSKTVTSQPIPVIAPQQSPEPVLEPAGEPFLGDPELLGWVGRRVRASLKLSRTHSAPPEPLESLAQFYRLPPDAANARRLGAWLEDQQEIGEIELPPATLLENVQAHADYRYYLVALLARSSNGEELLWSLFQQGQGYPALAPLAPLGLSWCERTIAWMRSTADATPYQLSCLRDWVRRDDSLAQAALASDLVAFRIFAYLPGRVEPEQALPTLLRYLNTELGDYAAESLMLWLDRPEVADAVQQHLQQSEGRAQGVCRLAASLWPGQFDWVEESLQREISLVRKCALVRGLCYYGEAAKPLLEWLLLHRDLEVVIVAAGVLGGQQELLGRLASHYVSQPYEQLLQWTRTFGDPDSPTEIEALGWLDLLADQRNDEFYAGRVSEVQGSVRANFPAVEVWVPAPVWRPEAGEVADCPEEIQRELLALLNRSFPEHRFSQRGLMRVGMARAVREHASDLRDYLETHFPDPVLLASVQRAIERRDLCELANFRDRLEFFMDATAGY